MIVIAHRGNIIGPDSKDENTQSAAQKAIDFNYHVELDLWKCLKDDQWWFGHDSPQNIIPKSFILKNKNQIWIHAKTGEALQLALDHKLKCFYHNVDDFTLVSNGYIWRYPDTSLPITRDTVIVMPESIKSAKTLQLGRGVCTDYPLLLKTALSTIHPDDIWFQGLELEKTYTEIENRKIEEYKYNSFPINDTRRCIAVFSDFEYNSKFEPIADYLETMCKEQCIYTLLTQENVENRGTLHFTWMQLSDFEYCEKNGITKETLKDFETIVNNNNVYTYFPFIVYHKVLLLPNGLLLVGYPSWNILKWRQYVRDQNYQHFHEPHAQNIVHSTLVRFTQPIENVDQIVEDIQTLLPLKLILKPKQLSKCSWRMGLEVQRQ